MQGLDPEVDSLPTFLLELGTHKPLGKDRPAFARRVFSLLILVGVHGLGKGRIVLQAELVSPQLPEVLREGMAVAEPGTQAVGLAQPHPASKKTIKCRPGSK